MCIHTNIHSSILPYFSIPNYSSIPVIFSFLFLLSSFLFFFLSLLFSLSRFCSPLSKTKMRYFFLVLSLFDLIPFLFHFPRRKLPPFFLQATCLFHNFLPYFILISFFYCSLVLQFSITLDLTYAYSYVGI